MLPSSSNDNSSSVALILQLAEKIPKEHFVEILKTIQIMETETQKRKTEEEITKRIREEEITKRALIMNNYCNNNHSMMSIPYTIPPADYLSTLYEKNLITTLDVPDWISSIATIVHNPMVNVNDEAKILKELSMMIKKINDDMKTIIDTHSHVTLNGKKPYLAFLNPNIKVKGKIFYRNLSYLFEDIAELKVSMSDNEGIGQLLYHLEKLLDQIKYRTDTVSGFLSNYSSIIFAKAYLRNGITKFTVTKELPLFNPDEEIVNYASQGLNYLKGFLNMKSTQPMPMRKLEFKEVIGIGGSSIVVREGHDRAVKICKSNHYVKFIKQEKLIINELLLNNIENIPKIIEHDEYSITFQRYEAVKELTIENMKILIELLKKVHQLGYCHCDIRPFNLLQSRDNGNVILADWGMAYPLETLRGFGGTHLFSSEDYQKICLSDRYTCYLPEYDLESLLKTFAYYEYDLEENCFEFYQWNQDNEIGLNKAREFWKKVGNEHSDFKECLEKIRNSEGYDALYSFCDMHDE